MSKPITAKDLQDFSEALEKNPLLKYQMGSAGKLLVILAILTPSRETKLVHFLLYFQNTISELNSELCSF